LATAKAADVRNSLSISGVARKLLTANSLHVTFTGKDNTADVVHFAFVVSSGHKKIDKIFPNTSSARKPLGKYVLFLPHFKKNIEFAFDQ